MREKCRFDRYDESPPGRHYLAFPACIMQQIHTEWRTKDHLRYLRGTGLFEHLWREQVLSSRSHLSRLLLGRPSVSVSVHLSSNFFPIFHLPFFSKAHRMRSQNGRDWARLCRDIVARRLEAFLSQRVLNLGRLRASTMSQGPQPWSCQPRLYFV